MRRPQPFFLLAFFLVPFVSLSQNNRKADSLEHVLAQVTEQKKQSGKTVSPAHDSLIAQLDHALYSEYLNSQPKKAIAFAEDELAVSTAGGYTRGIILGNGDLGVAWKNGGDYPRALEYFQEALSLAEKNQFKKEQASSYLNIANVYDKQGNFDEALKYDSIALRSFDPKKDVAGIANCYNNLGILFKEKGNYEEALKNYNLCMELRKKAGLQQGIAAAYNNIGGVYVRLKDFDKARENYFESLKIKEQTNDVAGMAVSYNNIGMTYYLQGDYAKAMDYEKKGLALSLQVGALDRVLDAYDILYRTDSATGNFKDAFLYHQLFLQTKDSLFSLEKEKKFTQLVMKYDFAKKHQADSLQHVAEQRVADEQLKKQETLTYVGFAGLALVAVSLFFVYRNYDNQRKANALLKRTQEQLVQQEKLASLGELTAGLAHEIRNPMNFVKNFAQLSTEMIDELAATKDEEERKLIEENLKQNLQKINHHGLRVDNVVKTMLDHSRPADQKRQPTDINALCEEMALLAAQSAANSHPKLDATLQKEFAANLPRVNVVGLDISRVIQNLLMNAYYAVNERKQKEGASYQPVIILKTQQTHQQVIISVYDNGTGIPEEIAGKIFNPFFTTKSNGKGTGLGLSMSFDTVKAYGGEITARSVPGSTEFTVKLPLS